VKGLSVTFGAFSHALGTISVPLTHFGLSRFLRRLVTALRCEAGDVSAATRKDIGNLSLNVADAYPRVGFRSR